MTKWDNSNESPKQIYLANNEMEMAPEQLLQGVNTNEGVVEYENRFSFVLNDTEDKKNIYGKSEFNWDWNAINMNIKDYPFLM